MRTLVWSSSISEALCQQYNLNCDFVEPSREFALDTFADLPVAGLTVSGYVYSLEICVDITCVYTDVNVVSQVSSAAWSVENQNNSTGILGFGPLSPIWYAYTEPETYSSVSSLMLANTTAQRLGES